MSCFSRTETNRVYAENSAEYNRCMEALLTMIIDTGCPLNFVENEQKIVRMSSTVNLLLAHRNKVALVDLLSDSLKQLSSDLNIENIAEKRYNSLL
jgi:hypothetical protein